VFLNHYASENTGAERDEDAGARNGIGQIVGNAVGQRINRGDRDRNGDETHRRSIVTRAQ
jgi:hypothetical protein